MEKQECGDLDNVQRQRSMFEQGKVEQQGGGRMRTDICVITNGSGESAILSKVMYLVREDGTKKKLSWRSSGKLRRAPSTTGTGSLVAKVKEYRRSVSNERIGLLALSWQEER